MRKIQSFIVKSKPVFIGLEDSKRTWKLCIRCDGVIVHETSMPTKYDNLHSYLRDRYPDCKIQVTFAWANKT